MLLDVMHSDSRYLLDNAAPETERRFASLETLYDPTTFDHLAATGVGAGWRCLEVGAGGGSITRWLARRVGPSGGVLATDIDPRWLDRGGASNIEVRRHSIAHEDLPEAAFDLVHARLVLIHVPERAAALRRMAAALRPGGWLVLEDFDVRLLPYCLDVRGPGEELANRVWDAFSTLLETRGADTSYGRKLPRLVREAGLVDVRAEARMAFAPGGSPGAELLHSNVDQVGDELLARGLATAGDLAAYRELLRDPEFDLTLHLMVSVTGRRPASPPPGERNLIPNS